MLLFISGLFSSIMLFINRKAKKICALRQYFLAAQQAVLCFCIFFINLNKKEHIRKYKTIYFYEGCFATLNKLKISIKQTKGKLAKLFCKNFLFVFESVICFYERPVSATKRAFFIGSSLLFYYFILVDIYFCSLLGYA